MTNNFNKKIKSGEGQLVVMNIIKHTDVIAPIGMGSAQAMLEHPRYLIMSSTAKKLGMRSMCANEIYERCIKGKQQQKNVNKKVSLRQ